MGAAVYFLMIRPQQKRAKEQKNLMNDLGEGSRVMTVSGIIGTVKHLGEKQAVIEVSPGVEMTIDKRAISPQVVEDEFEYADDSTEATEVEGAQPAALEAAEQPVLEAAEDAMSWAEPEEPAAAEAEVD
ncbi:MAG: preprotein translocase subunit YajC, partial [Propionicimonas sp.]